VLQEVPQSTTVVVQCK